MDTAPAKDQDYERLARAVGVKWLVEGSVQPGASPGEITVGVKLENVPERRIVWTDRFSAAPRE